MEELTQQKFQPDKILKPQLLHAPTFAKIKIFFMRTTILLTLLRMFSSCPGIFKFSGKIVSDKTETPIEGAKIELIDIPPHVHLGSSKNIYDSSSLSDKNGRFTASSIMRRMIFGLPKYRIRITKSGYENIEIKIDLKGKSSPNLFRLIEN